MTRSTSATPWSVVRGAIVSESLPLHASPVSDHWLKLRNKPPPPPNPLQARRRPFLENYSDDPDTIAHTREFLDCVKSRKRPSSDVEIGYYSSLPTLLAIQAIRQGRSVKYDAGAHKAVPV